MEFVDLKKQYARIKDRVDARMHAVLEHGHYVMGREIVELERSLASRTGSRHCIACSSGTDALLLALMALNVGTGDEVITTPFTFISTAETIALLGAKPVFVDIELPTYHLNPSKLSGAITSRTKAIMPVSLYGQCAKMNEINGIANMHGIPVIEDAAQSFGATYCGKPSCNLSTIGCTSFFPSKPLGCYGDGGACFTNDDLLATRMRQIRVHGQDKRYHHPLIGINGRMDTLQAAVVLAKLEIFDSEIADRVRLATAYDEAIKEFATTPLVEAHNTSVYAQYTIQVEERNRVQQQLHERGIPTAVHYPVPLHMQPAFASCGAGPGSFPQAEGAAQRVLSLPMHPYLTEEEKDQVVGELRTAVMHCGGAVHA